MEPPIEHRDVTTIMGLLGDIHEDVQAIDTCSRTRMAKKKRPKLTPDDLARRAETQRMVRERIAYHEAKAREDDARRAKRRG